MPRTHRLQSSNKSRRAKRIVLVGWRVQHEGTFYRAYIKLLKRGSLKGVYRAIGSLKGVYRVI